MTGDRHGEPRNQIISIHKKAHQKEEHLEQWGNSGRQSSDRTGRYVSVGRMVSVAVNARREIRRGSLFGLGGAVLFGASTPLSKLLLPGVGPLMLAALLYLGAALLISVFRVFSRIGRKQSAEARLRNSDALTLGAVVAFGGVLGPVLMLFGLARISALTGSLLLNLEAVFTILLAVIVFHEHLSRSLAAASGLVVFGALLLSNQPGNLGGGILGVMAIVGACLSWAIDNNLSQRLSLRDPTAVVQVKTAGAGLTSLTLALASGHTFPAPTFLVGGLALGSLGYGASLVCVMLALRYLGAAREAAWFSTAPFIGAALAVPIFGVLPTTAEWLGMASMIAGVFLLVRERHSHVHSHQPIEHDHAHVHDEHHQHEHEGPVAEPHSHSHRHDPIIHEHLHVSDLHHRHRHSEVGEK
jgi:drug/metabolite transporter (DMT)-like permease